MDMLNSLEFGDSLELSLDQESVVACIRLVCVLYSGSSNNMDIDLLRHKSFTQKSLSGDKLPPTLDSLTLDLRRANYQCFIWKPTCDPLLKLPEPTGNGWIRIAESLDQRKMINNTVPDVIVELIHCKCTKGCRNKLCSYRKAKLCCIDACLCNARDECENFEEKVSSDISSNEED